MKKDEIAIRVRDVKKDFVLPREKLGGVRGKLFGMQTKEVQQALRGVSFDVKKGEFFGILGRNGSGKSTMLKILADIYRATSGSVEHHGKLVPFIELGVGFHPDLSGRENVYLNGAMLGYSNAEIDKKYDEIVRFAELEEFMDQKLKNYSSGMQVRLAFSVATRAQADILLVDEVLAVGDAAFQRKSYEFFKELKRKKRTVVFVTHDMKAVEEYCDRAVLIEGGEVVFDGDAGEAARRYTDLFNKVDGGVKRGVADESVWVSSASATAGEKVRAEIEVSANEDVGDLTMGFVVRTVTDEVVAAVNTMNAKKGAVKKFAIKAGKKKRVVFEVDNFFGNGTYNLGYVLRSNDATRTYEINKRFAEFTSVRQDALYPVVLPAELKIEDVK